ncbi:MAG: pitrilysin family protein [bacterium]|nr:pitrilysin family protein [bacterium]
MQTRDPLKFRKASLSNGITAYLNLALPINGVLLGMVFPAGSRDDEMGKEGCAHFTEHMLFKGTRRFHDKVAIAAPIERCGGHVEACTMAEKMIFGARVLSEDIETAAIALNDLTVHALNRQKDFVKERGVISKEWKEYFSDADAYAVKLLHGHLFKNHPLAHSIIGEKKTIRALTVADIRNFYDRFIRTGPFTLFAIGGANTSQVMRTLEKVFGKRRVAPTLRKPSALSAVAPARIKVNDMPYPQTFVLLGTRMFPARDRKRSVAMDVLTIMLQDGISSPLFMALREPKRGAGLAYSFNFSCCGHTEASLAAFGVMTSYKDVNRVTRVFHETLAKVVTDASRFKEVKTAIVKSGQLEEWEAGEILDAASYAVVECGEDPRPTSAYFDDVSRVTMEDVAFLANEYLMPEHFTTVVVRGSVT